MRAGCRQPARPRAPTSPPSPPRREPGPDRFRAPCWRHDRLRPAQLEETTMPKTPVLIFLTAIAVGTALFAETGSANPAAGQISTNAPDQGVQLVHYGPGSCTRTGRPRCRTVIVPGSGQGPQRGGERIPRCRTVVVPGSGRGPERVCD